MATLTNSFSRHLQKRTKTELPGLPSHFNQTLRPGFLLQMSRMCLHLGHSAPGRRPREAKESYSLEKQHETEMD